MARSNTPRQPAPADDTPESPSTAEPTDRAGELRAQRAELQAALEHVNAELAQLS